MLSAVDSRAFASPDDRFQRCTFCGKELVVLPEDRRGGTCFDCRSLLGSDGVPCPACGGEILAERSSEGCERCGWVLAGS